MEYKLIKICKCGHGDEIPLTKREAAFDLYENRKDIWNAKCSKCGGKTCISTRVHKPAIDKALLVEWANSINLFFDEQEEEIVLAEATYIDLILDVIDNHKILEANRNILVAALCLIICINSEESTAKNLTAEETENRSKIVTKVANELKARKDIVLLAENWIMNDIKEKVFPILGVKY